MKLYVLYRCLDLTKKPSVPLMPKIGLCQECNI